MFTCSQENFQAMWNVFLEIVGRSKYVLANRMAYDDVTPPLFTSMPNPTDYVRWRSLTLVGELINTAPVEGSVAEAGVFCGAFSRLINATFKTRKMYLFDTFEGFNREQIEKEHRDGLIHDWFTQEGVFAKTNEELVLSMMPFKENCVICKGLFEEASKNVDDTFAFVSLDMDLYEPMLAALEYFYPRLARGGYIFMHDYNHSLILGVKKAIQEYEAKHQCLLPKMPIPDEGGSVAIMKL